MPATRLSRWLQRIKALRRNNWLRFALVHKFSRLVHSPLRNALGVPKPYTWPL